MNTVSSPPVNASATRRGLISTAAQTIAGVKTFAAILVASAGVQLSSLFNTNGSAAADVMLKLGTTRTDAQGIDAAAKVASFRTGIGTGSESEKGYFLPDGTYSLGSGLVQFGTLVYGRGSWIIGSVNGGIGWMTSNFGAYLYQSPGNGNLYASHQFNGTTFTGLGYYAGANAGANFAGTNGGSASDVSTKIGTTTADASVNTSAKLVSIRTGIGATEVERFYFTKDLFYLGGGGLWAVNNNFGGHLGFQTGSTNVLALLTSGILRSGYGFDINPGFGANLSLQLLSSGRIDQSGTDSSGSPGSRTGANAINKPSGVSAIAGGSTTCQIENSLVTATSKILITWYGDLGTQSKIPWVTRAAGSFTVNVGTAPAGAVAFGWEVSSLI